MPLLLSGCYALPSEINPVSWWHSLEGGQVAEQRPPPPAADAPYPSLATVPPKPAPTDPAQRTRIADALIADRANAQYAAAQTPLPDPSSRTASPALFGGAAPPPAPVDPNASTASLAAASAPPAPPSPSQAPPSQASPSQASPFQKAAPPAPAIPPARAPRAGVAESPLPPPAGSPQVAQAAPPPAIPDAPPPAPVLPGTAIPITAPTPPPVAPPKPAAPPVVPAGAPVPVAFPPGSAVLPAGADAPLKKLAAGRGAAAIAVTGFGDATVTAPDVQASAIKLGLLRAQAIAAVFAAIGVPPAAVRVDAQATGTGGEARLVAP